MSFAAKLGDPTSVGTVVQGPGSANVFVEGVPAITATNMTTPHPVYGAPGTYSVGSTTVFINGLPAVRTIDVDSNGGMSTLGAPSIIIG